MSETRINHSSAYRLCLLLGLYMSQGLPFGFQATTLPVWLRKNNASLALIGFAGVLSVPWMFKFLLAPMVDRFSRGILGPRKSWIIPLQILLVITIILAGSINLETGFYQLLLMVFLMNVLASLQDIAVDGLAIDILSGRELGAGNAAQVAGYKCGMILSGGIMMWLGSLYGHHFYFITMAVIASIPVILMIFYCEDTGDRKNRVNLTIGKIVQHVIDRVKRPDGLWLIFFIATYKTGESMIDTMFKPFLVDNGFTEGQIGLWVGTWGMAASIIGSIAGGVLCRYITLFRALSFTLLLRLVPLAGEAAIAICIPGSWAVILVTIAEHFFGGMLTVAVFALMMSRVDHEAAATHYTVLASVEVFGKSPGMWLSGILAQIMGYFSLFLTGLILSILVMVMLPLLNKNGCGENV